MRTNSFIIRIISVSCIVLLVLSIININTFANNKGESIVEPTISSDMSHALAIKKDGTVWAWGWNGHGILGDGTEEKRNIPIQIKQLKNIRAISAGGHISIALKDDGTVWAWGDNQNGSVGDGTNTNRFLPVMVEGINNVIAISAGDEHCLALKADGTVWAWGFNEFGSVGEGTTEDRISPVLVAGLDNIASIGAGGKLSAALKKDGTVWCWGKNKQGGVGDGSTENRHIPVKVKGLSNIKAISVGGDHILALKSDNTVWGWGANGNGQLGDGSCIDRYIPVQVVGLTDVVKIDVGENFSLALKNDGTVWSWGSNMYYQLGPGVEGGWGANQNTPIQVAGVTNIVHICAGKSHCLAIKDDGTVWGWGRNKEGQLGNGTWNEYVYFPQKCILKLDIIKELDNVENNRIRIFLNGVILETNEEPFIINNTTLVPMRIIFEALGTEVKWLSETNMVSARRGEIHLQIPINQNYAILQGKEINLQVPAMIIDARTYVPLRFVAESMNSDVFWDDTNRIIYISSSFISNPLGETTITIEDIIKYKSNPDVLQEKIKTIFDLIKYIEIADYGPENGDIKMLENGIQWHHNRTGISAIEKYFGNCGGTASFVNYLLKGDYEEVGFLNYSCAPRQGGHNFNYIKEDGKYYCIDFQQFRETSGAYNIYKPKGYQNLKQFAQEYISSFNRSSNMIIKIFVSYTADDVLPVGAKYPGGVMLVFPEDSNVNVLYETPDEGYTIEFSRNPNNIPDWDKI